MSDTEITETDSMKSEISGKKVKITKEKVKKEPPKKEPKGTEEKSEEKIAPQKKLKVKEMVDEALIILHHRKGTSLRAIKKHISENNNYDEKRIKRISSKITDYLSECFQNETLVQLKGKGASGSFKLVEKPKVKKTKQETEKKEKPEKEPKEKETKKKLTKGKEEDKQKKEPTKPKKEPKPHDMEKLKKARKSIGLTVKRKSIHALKLKPKLKKGEKVIKEGKKKAETDQEPQVKTTTRGSSK